MNYAILIYGSEAAIAARSKEAQAKAMARHATLQKRLSAENKLGPNMSLMPTTTATTVRISGEPLVTDGPFAETKEQLLGLYVVDCATLDEAIEVARELAHEYSSLEIRPIRILNPGGKP